ncbi:uncharacterized protein LOC116425510 isoform X2 [Nomia melanderi]|uniref:uncharacterized protein LOC116425510 isoform X2 n=1 Tax=Nomia melanderi TaxID=2448451 RepID=UPI0013043980|nr:ankyrin repeat domain-containing protein 54-like isoform X2 [Nomia melanderi]
MTSVDSGVEMGNDSNDSSIAQHETLSSNQVSTINSTMTTTTTTMTTTATSYENGTDIFFIEEVGKPIGLPSTISFLPMIKNYTEGRINEISMPTSSVRPLVFSPSLQGLELQLPCLYPADRLSEYSDVLKYKSNCHGKIKSLCASRNRHMSGTYAFDKGSDVYCKLMKSKMRSAAATNNTSLMKRLLSTGVSPNIHDGTGRTALHVASGYGYTEMVQLLLEYGADPNQRDCVGNTPLHLASLAHQISVVTLLLKAEAKIISRNKDGYNPLQLAQSHLKLFQNCKEEDMQRVKQEIHDTVNMLLTYLQKQKSSHETVEALSTFYSRLSLSNTANQVQDDVKDLLANLDALNITS